MLASSCFQHGDELAPAHHTESPNEEACKPISVCAASCSIPGPGHAKKLNFVLLHNRFKFQLIHSEDMWSCIQRGSSSENNLQGASACAQTLTPHRSPLFHPRAEQLHGRSGWFTSPAFR